MFAGQAAVIDFGGAQAPTSVTRAPAAMVALLGEPGAGVAGGSRATAILRLREMLQDAQRLRANRVAFNTAQRRDYARSRLDLEALQPGAERAAPARHPGQPRQRPARGDPPRRRIQAASRAHRRLRRLDGGDAARAPQKLPVVIKPLTNIPTFESLNATLENAARLSRAGVTVVLASFDTQNSRTLRQEAGNAIANGMDRDGRAARRSRSPRRGCGASPTASDRSNAGKDADLVIWSGDPFELTGGAEHVFIKGVEVPRDTRQTQLLQKYRKLPR